MCWCIAVSEIYEFNLTKKKKMNNLKNGYSQFYTIPVVEMVQPNVVIDLMVDMISLQESVLKVKIAIF